jgi:hypothetical protein
VFPGGHSKKTLLVLGSVRDVSSPWMSGYSAIIESLYRRENKLKRQRLKIR